MRWRRFTTSAALWLIVLAFGLDASAQQTGRITGRVVDAATKRPLAGVQVFIPPTGIGNITDADGRYLLQNVPAGRYTVTAQLVGYKQGTAEATVTAGQTSTVPLQLNETAIALEEIVVTGAGIATQRKKLGNTIAAIDAAKVSTAAVTDVSQMLAAREPGVSILPASGMTGEGARIRIRGSSSLTQLNEPIVYVDGIRVDRFAISGRGGSQGNPSKLDDIPPEAIERVEILKGAAAATLYGTEASNGVIQIFTKKGRSGAPRFTAQIDQTAITMPLNRMLPVSDFAENAADVARIKERWGRDVQLFQPFQEDIFKDIFSTGYHQAYSLSVTGGSDRVSYFVTGRFQDEAGPMDPWGAFGEVEGLKKTNDVQRRMQTTANVVITPVEKIRIGVNTMYSELKQNTPENGNNIYGVFPNATQAHLRLASPTNLYGSNAFMTLREGVYQIDEVEANHFTGSTNLNYSPIQSLKVDASFGIDFTNESNFYFLPFKWNVDSYSANRPEGYRSIGEIRTRVLTADLKTAWDANLTDNISSTLLLGTQGFLNQRTSKGGTGNRFPGPGLEVAEAGAEKSVSEFWTRNTQVGAYLQDQLGWKDWAFVTVGGRWDANSAFGESFRTAFYPKVSVSLLPTQAFGWENETFSTVRVRGALGKSGLQPSSFDKFTTYSPQASVDGPGLRPANLGNQDLKPEVSTEIEVGAELGMWQDRASVSFTYWSTKVSDALVARQFPVTGGFRSTQLDNIGQMSKHGIEVAINGSVLRREKINLSVFANGERMSQTIDDLGGAPALKTGGSYSRYRQFLVEGYAPGSFFGPKLADVTIPLNLGFRNTDGSCREPTRAEALAYFATARDPGAFKPLVLGNEPGKFNAPNGKLASHNCGTGALLTYLGKSMPDWAGSFGFTIGLLNNFEINSTMEFKAGNYSVHDLSGEFRRSHAGIGRNIPRATELESIMRNPASTAEQRLEAAVAWAKEIEGLAPLDGLNSIDPADYIRWRELSLTYRVPTSLIDRWGLASASLSLGARNMALWVNDAYKGMDPEGNISGRCNGGLDCNFLDATDGWTLPITRRVTLSTRVSF